AYSRVAPDTWTNKDPLAMSRRILMPCPVPDDPPPPIQQSAKSMKTGMAQPATGLMSTLSSRHTSNQQLLKCSAWTVSADRGAEQSMRTFDPQLVVSTSSMLASPVAVMRMAYPAVAPSSAVSDIRLIRWLAPWIV